MSQPRPFILLDANYKQLLSDRPNVAVLPWGATEAHNYHLPHGTDVIEAVTLAHRAAELAHGRGAKVIVLPEIPYGNDSQQLDQVATISISTATALAILIDVARSLKLQGIDRLVLLNGHGGNDFKPLVRDVQLALGAMIVVINFWQLCPDVQKEIFEDPGDHGGELETSFILHVRPDLVQMAQAGSGGSMPFKLKTLKSPGVWTPRPWSKTQPDTGSGDPSKATAEKGRRYFERLCEEVAAVLMELSGATKGDLPY
jgi:creatinine amidohydrolase